MAPARPGPWAVPATPSEIMPRIWEAGQGVRGEELGALHVNVPEWSCIRPGLETVPSGDMLVEARTQPLLSSGVGR